MVEARVFDRYGAGGADGRSGRHRPTDAPALRGSGGGYAFGATVVDGGGPYCRFQAVPVTMPWGDASTVFDETLALSTAWVEHLPSGLVVGSGDVILTFDAASVNWEPFPPIADYGFLSDCEVTALVAPSVSVVTSTARAHEKGEKIVKLSDIPAPARAALLKEAKGAPITGIQPYPRRTLAGRPHARQYNVAHAGRLVAPFPLEARPGRT